MALQVMNGMTSCLITPCAPSREAVVFVEEKSSVLLGVLGEMLNHAVKVVSRRDYSLSFIIYTFVTGVMFQIMRVRS